MVEFRVPYDGKRYRVDLSFLDDNGEPQESLTEQHHKDSCDMIRILKKYDKTGLITHVNTSVANYGDFTAVNEYQESLNMVINAQDAFNELPSEIRKKFGYDPGLFFEFATDPSNKEKMIEYGLANPPQVVEEVIQKVEVVNADTE